MSLGGEIKKEKKRRRRKDRKKGRKKRENEIRRQSSVFKPNRVCKLSHVRETPRETVQLERNFIFIEDDQRNRRHLSNVFDILEIFPDY